MAEYKMRMEEAQDTLLCLMGLSKPVEGSAQVKLWDAIVWAIEDHDGGEVLSIMASEAIVQEAFAVLVQAHNRREGAPIAMAILQSTLKAWIEGKVQDLGFLNN